MMRSAFLRVGMLFVVLLLAIVPSAAQPITRGDPLSEALGVPNDPADPAHLRSIAEENGNVRVIVSLQTEQAGRMLFDNMSEQSQQADIAQTQDALLAELSMTRSTNGVKRYTAFPSLALTLSTEQLAIVQGSALVTDIREDRWRAPSLFEGTTNIGMRGSNGAWASGADGEGQVVVILDSGVQGAHGYLTGKVVAEACFSSNVTGNGFTVSSLCPNGETSSLDSGGGPCVLLDQIAVNQGKCNHGTRIANIIAGRDTLNAQNPFHGVAPEAKLISIQVFSRITDDNNDATAPVCKVSGYPSNECILASDSDVLRGLDHAYILRNFYTIAAVNMSFGNESWTSQAACDAAYPAYKARVDLFRAAGIAVVSSSGNQSGLSFMNAPACINGVISVGASCDSGSSECAVNTLWRATNTAPFLTFLAPGVGIDAAIPGTLPGGAPNHAPDRGTSYAAAFVSGAYAALRSYRPGATIDQITNVLRESAVPIDDAWTIPIERYAKIQLNAALPLLIFPDQPTLLSPASNAAIAEGPITFVWTAGEETNNYRLQLYNSSRSTVLKTVKVNHNTCAEDPVGYPDEEEVCSASIDYNFKDNQSYQWRVVARNNSNGSSSASAWRTFQFDTPGAALLLSPARKITINQPEELVQFQWSEVDLATQYRVTLYDKKNGSVKLNRLVEEGDVCAAEVCTYTTTPADVSGLRDDRKYKWYVTSISNKGTSRSAERTITAKFPAPPLLTSPADKHVFRSLNDIELTWTEVAGAEEYVIRIVDTANGKTVITETMLVEARAINCLSGTCTFVPSANQKTKFKNKRTYRWTVTASNQLGSNASAPLTFKTKIPAPPVLISPEHKIMLDNPAITFTFTEIADVDSYELVIALKSNGKAIVKRGLTPGGNLSCNGAECVYTLNSRDQGKLKNGKTYQWYARSISTAGKSASAKREFTLQSPLPAALIAPANKARLHSPADATFAWDDLGAGVSYQLRLRDPKAGKIIVKVNISGAACPGGTCSYTLTNAQQGQLKDGRSYKWWVISTNSFGKSTSAKRNLSTEFPRVPAPLAPANKSTLSSPEALTVMEWRSGGTASDVTYQLLVRRADNGKTVFKKTFTNGAGLTCDAGKCLYDVEQELRDVLRDGRNYKWWVVASSANGKKNGAKFTLKARF